MPEANISSEDAGKRETRGTAPGEGARTKVDLAYELLLSRIVSGQLAEGDRVVMGELAREFGTSTIPVREALARLQAERFVTFEANKGYRVAPKPDPVELDHLFEARVILEIGAVREGIAKATAVDLAELEAINSELARVEVGESRAGNVAFIAANEAFHVALVKLCANPFIVDAYNRLGYHQRIRQTLYRIGDPDSRRVLREHDEIIRALGTGDPAAAEEALRAHIRFGQSRLYDVSYELRAQRTRP